MEAVQEKDDRQRRLARREIYNTVRKRGGAAKTDRDRDRDIEIEIKCIYV